MAARFRTRSVALFLVRVRRSRCALVAGLAAALAFSAVDAAARDLRVALTARDVGSLDPASTRGNVDEFIVRQMFNSLISPPYGTLQAGLDQIKGELAESWEVSKDYRSWTFRLRHGVKWHRGYGEVTAEDVKFSFERQIDPKSGAVYSSSFTDIESIDILDPLTVRFVLKRPNTHFHASALMPRFGGYIVPKKAVTELGRDFALKPVGSGAFEFVSYDPKRAVKLKAFAGYYAGTPKVDGVDFFLMPEATARTLAFIGGELDIIEAARSPGWSNEIKQKKPDAIFDALRPGSIQTLFLNMTKPPFDKLEVRQAVAYGLDRKVWAQAFGLFSGPLYGPVPPEYDGGLKREDVPADLLYPLDQNRAKALLAKAGYPNGFGVDVFVSERDDYRINMLLVQEQLRKIGLNINLRVVDHASYHADSGKDLNTMVVYSSSQPPTAAPILDAFYTSDAIVTKPNGNRNYSHYGGIGGNIDKEFAAALAEADSDRRLAAFRDIQLRIMRDLPVIPLQTLAVVFVRQPSIDLGFTPNAGLGNYPLSLATIRN